MAPDPAHDPAHDPGDEYVGPARLSAASDRDAPTAVELDVEVTLRGHFEPLDGRFHWYGRVAAHDELRDRVRSGSTVVLTTSRGSAEGRLSDLDTWGRFRVTGTGRPPF